MLLADAAAFRLDRTPIRLVAATGSLVVVLLLYLVAQVIGAGKAVELLLGINYWLAVAGVGALMILYVTVGGMQAMTWVRITKAALLMYGGTLLALAVLWHFDLSLGELFTVKDAAGARKRRYPACRGGDHPRICATSTIHSGDE